MAHPKPTKLPEWASAPPTPPPTTITEPTEPEKQAGFQPGNARRQFVNWLFNLIWQWFAWLTGSGWKASDEHPDHALPLGTPPVTGTGLVQGAASFTGNVFVNGYRVGLEVTGAPVPNPATTYPINSDNYWDLSESGAWVLTSVAAMAAAPAVAANSIRVYMVRTNGVDRTAVTDFRELEVRHKAGSDYDQISIGRKKAAGRLGFGQLWRAGGLAGEAYEPHIDSEANTGSGQPRWQLYSGVGAGRRVWLVWGATLTTNAGLTAWTLHGSLTEAYRIGLGPGGSAGNTPVDGLVAQVVSGLGAGATFLDTVWGDEDDAGTFLQLILSSGVVTGAALNQGADAAKNKTPGRQIARIAKADLRYTLVDADLDFLATGEGTPIREYATADLFGLGGSIPATHKVVTYNAEYSEATGRWSRDTAGTGQDSFMFTMGPSGLRAYRHRVGDASPWDDTPGNGTDEWDPIAAFGDDLIGPSVKQDFDGTIHLPGSTKTADDYEWTDTDPVYGDGRLFSTWIDASEFKASSASEATNAAANSWAYNSPDFGIANPAYLTLDSAADLAAFAPIKVPQGAELQDITYYLTNTDNASTVVEVWRDPKVGDASADADSLFISTTLPAMTGPSASRATTPFTRSFTSDNIVDNESYRYLAMIKNLAGKETFICGARVRFRQVKVASA